MGKFIKKALLLLAPLFVLVFCYVITDPYQNIFERDTYLLEYMMLSRGNVSAKVYLKNKDKYKYDSFIFGSSRSTAHTAAEWSKYLAKDNVPFSFGAWNENIEGMYRRLRLIDSLKSPIRNAFILIDVDHTFTKSDTDKMADFASDHYLITGESKFRYYVSGFMNYIENPKLILTSIDYKLFHKQRAYMENFVHMEKGDLDPVTNDWLPNSEKTVLRDTVAYYKASEHKFYQRPAVQIYAKKQITPKKVSYLHKIAAILQKHHTNYKIVIAPLYDQVKLNPADLAILCRVFGRQRVYDYSGINNITNNRFNYGSDVTHYRKKAGNLIFKEIYR
ncbi:MAG: hypothetical protein JWR02_2663 [Mucilaginibacter sp.]|nr:hypothetical protein [Mucilaginibacter sp.]